MQESNYNIFITGASSGIGEALALHYAQNGAKNLYLVGRNKERLDSVAEKCKSYGASVCNKIADVTAREEIHRFMAECNEIAPINLVFANAGVSTGEETPENIYNTFNINVMGTLNTVLAAMDIYKQRDGGKKIIAITASIAGYHGLPACPSYSASKACLKAYGEALRCNLLPDGIQVNTICPGFVKSRITDKNTCPMPFFMSAERAAEIIAERIDKNVGLIAFPWPMRLATWFLSVLPNRLSDFIYAKLPHKV